MATTRRNGQLSSCEPCRKSKLRCDHSTPICGRCFRRGQPDLCHYHPAPLTQEPGPRQQKRKRRNDDNGRTEPVLDRLPFLSAASTESPEGGLSDAYSPNWNQKKPSTSATGFLGLTSYSAVFSEHDKCIGAEIRSPATNDTVSANPKQIQVGAQILQLLSRNISFYEKMIEARFKLFQGWTLGRPTTLSLLKSIRNVLALHLSNENDDNAALSLSKRFFESTTKPIEHNNSMAFQEYISDITMRWESVGLLFATTGLSTSWIPYDDPAWKYSNQESPRDVAIRAITAGDICLQFCDHSVAMNDPLVWLLLHHTAGLTVAYGDSDSRAWKKMGEVSTAVFALGLHQEPDSTVPFFLKETRKRIMLAAYALDKQLATFLGRPPLISWRYCDIDPPLDLSYDEIVANPETRNAAIASLEENNGWNKEGIASKGGFARAILITSITREKVLELSLCRRADDLAQKVENMTQEAQQMRLELPQFLHWVPDNERSAQPHDDNMLFSLHIDFLYSEFLLYRILDRRTQGQSDGLINTSQEILNALRQMVGKKNRSRRAVLDIGWILCCFCLPAAGVLAIELLHRSQRRFQTTLTPFPRSEIIQNLSVFASYLESMVEPSEGNYEISQQGGKAIRHVLDRVLSEPVQPDMTTGSTDAALDTNILNDLELDEGMQFLNWLDHNVDYRQESWCNWLTFS